MNALPLTPMLYEDPAFSSDPHAHPFFHTPWSIKPDDDPRLFQPPKGPMLSDDHSSNTHESNSSSNHTSTTLSTPPTSIEDHSSQWPSQKPSLHWPPEVQKKKKSLTMFWRRTPPETVLALAEHPRNVSQEPSLPSRSMTPPLQPTIVAAPKIVSSEKPSLTRRPAAVNSKSPPIAARRIAGVAIRGSELDRIDELDESHPSGLPLHHMGPYEAANKVADNEATYSVNTTPHQASIHDSLPAAKPKQDRKDKQVDRNQQLHRRNFSEGTSVPIVPAGVSLNLSPGQILPSHFYHQLDQNFIPPTAPFHASGWPSPAPTRAQRQQQRINHQPQPQPPHWPRNQAQPRPQPQTRSSDTSHQIISHTIHAHERPPEIPFVAYDNLHARLDGQGSTPHAPPEYSALPNDPYAFQGDSKKLLLQVSQNLSHYGKDKKLGHDLPYSAHDYRRSNQFFVNEHQLYPEPPIVTIQPDFRVTTSGPRLHQQNNPRLPPRMQALQMQIPRTDEKHRRSPRSPSVSLDYQNFAPLNGQGPNHIAQHRWSHTPTPIDNTHQIPLFVDNNGFPTSPPAPLPLNIPQVVRVPNHPNNISQPPPGPDKTISSGYSTSNSIHSGIPRTGPPPSHLPKRLVMPAPLQTSQALVPQHQLPVQQVSANYIESQSWQPHLRPPVSTTFPQSYSENQLDPVDMQSRKLLRKRISTQGIPSSVPTNPTQPLFFAQTPSLHLDDLPLPQPLSIRKPDKIQKKVLSKRRTDF